MDINEMKALPKGLTSVATNDTITSRRKYDSD